MSASSEVVSSAEPATSAWARSTRAICFSSDLHMQSHRGLLSVSLFGAMLVPLEAHMLDQLLSTWRRGVMANGQPCARVLQEDFLAAAIACMCCTAGQHGYQAIRLSGSMIVAAHTFASDSASFCKQRSSENCKCGLDDSATVLGSTHESRSRTCGVQVNARSCQGCWLPHCRAGQSTHLRQRQVTGRLGGALQQVRRHVCGQLHSVTSRDLLHGLPHPLVCCLSTQGQHVLSLTQETSCVDMDADIRSDMWCSFHDVMLSSDSLPANTDSASKRG